MTTLRRTLGPWSATAIVVANMVGTGIFTTSGVLLERLGSPWWLFGVWAAGGLIALLGAVCYAELGAAMPEAGGEYTFLSRLYHPLLGFLSGWVSLFAGFSAPIAAAAIGIVEYASRTIAWGVPHRAAAAALVLGFTAIHARGLETGARVQNLLTFLKLALIAALVVGGFAIGQGSMSHVVRSEGANPPDARTVGLALLWVSFAYSGWNAAAYLGAEIREPERNIPRALLLGTGTVTALYLALNALFVWAVPPTDLAGEIAVGAVAAGALFGSGAERWFAIAIAIAMLSSLSAFLILGPRVYWAMAQDGSFFRFAAAVDERRAAPWKSVWLQGGLAAAMTVLGTFDQILTYMGFALGLFPLAAVAGLFVLRRRGGGPFRAPGFPWVALVYLACSAAILVLGFMERPVESTAALATVAAGVLAYPGTWRRFTSSSRAARVPRP